jgi:hypothetical protein
VSQSAEAEVSSDLELAGGMDELGNYAEVSAYFSSSGLQKPRPVTPSSAKDHCPGVCNPNIPIPAEMTGRFSSPRDELGERALDRRRRLLRLVKEQRGLRSAQVLSCSSRR